MESKLDRRDLGFIGGCLLVTIVCLLIGTHYFYRAFPEASIDFRVTREDAQTQRQRPHARERADDHRPAGAGASAQVRRPGLLCNAPGYSAGPLTPPCSYPLEPAGTCPSRLEPAGACSPGFERNAVRRVA